MIRTVPILVLIVVSMATSLVAAPNDQVKGTLLIGGKTYKLTQAVAYETKADDEMRLSVVLSDRQISANTVKAALKEGDGSDNNLRLRQPHVRLVFQKSGEIEMCSVWADDEMFNGGGDSLQGQLKLADRRVQGGAKLHFISPLDTVTSFDVQFNLGIGLDAAQQAPSAVPTAPAKPSISGTFIGNGKSAKLAFVSARRGEPFDDKPSILLVFSEKDHAKDNQPDIKASLGAYGSALILSVQEDGSIFGCQVAHAAHDKRGFSAVGAIRAAAFEIRSGGIEGHLTTDGQKTSFGQIWSADLHFVVPFKVEVTAKQTSRPASSGASSADPTRNQFRTITPNMRRRSMSMTYRSRPTSPTSNTRQLWNKSCSRAAVRSRNSLAAFPKHSHRKVGRPTARTW